MLGVAAAHPSCIRMLLLLLLRLLLLSWVRSGVVLDVVSWDFSSLLYSLFAEAEIIYTFFFFLLAASLPLQRGFPEDDGPPHHYLTQMDQRQRVIR